MEDECAREELATLGDDLEEACCLEAVCRESLGLDPIVPGSLRLLRRETVLCGALLAPGIGACGVSSRVSARRRSVTRGPAGGVRRRCLRPAGSGP